MKAVLRLGLVIATAGLWLGEAPALAQSAPAATTNTPVSDSIGPAQLQNFNLQGTVTKPAETAPPARPAAPASRPAATSDSPESASTPAIEPRTARRTARIEQPRAAPTAPTTASTLPSTTLQVTPAESAPPPVATGLPLAQPDEAPTTLAPERSLPIWPWLLTVLALVAGGAFLFRRRSSRLAYAGGPHVDAFVAPEPQPRVPAPPPAAAPAPPSKPVGFVSTRMRPWLELSFEPLRCIVEEQQVTFEFELELLNSGNAPARDVLIDGGLFNAGPTQDEEIGGYFASQAARGERIPIIPPMQRVSLRPQLTVPLEQFRMLEAADRKFFVPLIALNAVYAWGGGGGQTSAAWLLGRDTKGEKLGPFRVDLGPRVFRGLGARALPISVRR